MTMLVSEIASEEHERPGSAPAERRCIVSRESAPRAGLVRFVRGPDNTVVPDLAETLPGRGVWVTADRAKIETARQKNLFSQAFRAPAKAPEDLVVRIERLLAERAVALIGFARRADALVFGRDGVKAAIAADRIVLLLAAADSDGRDAADLAQRWHGERFAVLAAAEMGAALGREHIVHIGLKPGRLAEALARELRRLEGFRTAPESGAAPRAPRHRTEE